MRSYFPDVNVWLALFADKHQHNPTARIWYESDGGSHVYFTRHTQLGLLRLLTNPAVMGPEALTPEEAWRRYETALGDPRISFLAEMDPAEIDLRLQLESSLRREQNRDWSDSYILAFAWSHRLRLVTFDRGLARRGGDLALLLAQ